jgi:hypothetical protein
MIRNYASNLIFFVDWRGRPTKARQAHQGEAGRSRPTVIGRGTGNASCICQIDFHLFTDVIADIYSIKIRRYNQLKKFKGSFRGANRTNFNSDYFSI